MPTVGLQSTIAVIDSAAIVVYQSFGLLLPAVREEQGSVLFA
jgi:hypothetical protein